MLVEHWFDAPENLENTDQTVHPAACVVEKYPPGASLLFFRLYSLQQKRCAYSQVLYLLFMLHLQRAEYF